MTICGLDAALSPRIDGEFTAHPFRLKEFRTMAASPFADNGFNAEFAPREISKCIVRRHQPVESLVRGKHYFRKIGNRENIMKKTVNLLIIVCAVMIGLPRHAVAQSTGGTVHGVVRNQLREPVAGAKVTSINSGTNQTRSTQTDEGGLYRLPSLAVGTYEISVEADNFQKTVQQVTLRVGEDASVDIELSATGSAEQVNIVSSSSSAAMTETSSSVLGIVIENKQINELPLNGRNFLQLGTLVANVSSTASLKGGSEGGLLNGPFSVSGQRDRSQTFLVDGVDNNNTFTNSLSAQVSIDAIQEFKMISNLGSAEFGHHSGGMLNIITKSGTNEFHASVFEFFRNKALDAPNHFEKLAAQPASKFNNNQFGGTLGGRIIKDKAFFLVNYEGQRLRVGTPQFSNVPTVAERSGLFKNPTTGQNVQLSVDPVSQKVLDKYVPLPNTQNVLGNYLATPTIKSRSDFALARMDYLLSGDDVVNVRYFRSDTNTFNPIIANVILSSILPPTIPGFGFTELSRTHNLAVNYTHNFSTQVINDFRFGYNRHHNLQDPEDDAKPSDQGFGHLSTPTGMFQISIPGITKIGNYPLYPLQISMNNFHLADSLSWTSGRHALKAGGEVRLVREAETVSRAGAGTLTFTGLSTRISPLADFVTGAAAAGSLIVRDFGYPMRQAHFGLFVQDDYQVSHRLVLNLGLRYEVSSEFSSPTHHLRNYSVARGFFTPGEDGSSLYKPDHNNFAPRLGFAYTLTEDGRTVVRGGYGFFYDTLTFSSAATLDLNRAEDPFILVSFPSPGAGKLSTLFNPATLVNALAGAPTPRTYDEGLRTPYAQHFNLTFQRELGKSILISTGYVGTKTSKLLRERDINQAIFIPGVDAQGKPLSTSASANILARRPTQLYGLSKTPISTILQQETSASSIYHSFQATFTKRMGHGLSLLSAYTWAKSIDDATDPIGFTGDTGGPQNSHDLRPERALSIFDIRHRLTVGYTYELPSLGKTPWLNGWQVNGIATFQSGQPFTPILGFDPSLSSSLNVRPNHVPGAITSKDGQLFINPNLPRDPVRNIPIALIPKAGEFGTLGRNTFTGPGYKNVDVSLIKETRLSEGLRLQIRGELFNVFNTTNLALPLRSLTDPFFGLSRKTQDVAGGLPGIGGGGPRVVQLAVKLVY